MRIIITVLLLLSLISCQSQDKKEKELLQKENELLQKELDLLKKEQGIQPEEKEELVEEEYEPGEFEYLFGIRKDEVGPFPKGITVADLYEYFPKEQIKKTVVPGMFEDEFYEDYEFYDNTGNLMLVLTPAQNGNMNSYINRVMIKDSRFFIEGGIGINSTYGDLIEHHTPDDYSPDMDVIVVSLDDLGCNFTISKSELGDDWWGEDGVDPTKIPNNAKFESLIVWWR